MRKYETKSHEKWFQLHQPWQKPESVIRSMLAQYKTQLPTCPNNEGRQALTEKIERLHQLLQSD